MAATVPHKGSLHPPVVPGGVKFEKKIPRAIFQSKNDAQETIVDGRGRQTRVKKSTQIGKGVRRASKISGSSPQGSLKRM